MRRKTLSPIFVGAILLAFTACILMLTFYLQALNIKSMYGSDIRSAVYEANDMTGELSTSLSDIDYRSAVVYAARLEAMKDLGLLHPEIDKARHELSRALNEYADALLDGELSEGGMKLLSEDVMKANADLRLLLQHSIDTLADIDVKKMDRAFYKAMDSSSRIYKELTLLANHEG